MTGQMAALRDGTVVRTLKLNACFSEARHLVGQRCTRRSETYRFNLTVNIEQPMQSGIEYGVSMRVGTAIFRSIQMSQKTVTAGRSTTVAFANSATVFSLCLGLTLIHTPLPASADDSWGCLSQSLFWARVKETVTDSKKSHEIELSGRHHDSGYSHNNEYFKYCSLSFL